jgi:hypothetical protein
MELIQHMEYPMKMRGRDGPASAICYLSLKDPLRGMFKDLKKALLHTGNKSNAVR